MTDLPAIISKEDAIAQGLKFFFTGKPCRNGHISERYTYPNAPCVRCLRENSTKHLKARPNYKPRPSICVQREDGTWHGDPCPKCGGTERAGKTRLKCPTCWREKGKGSSDHRRKLQRESYYRNHEINKERKREKSKQNSNRAANYELAALRRAESIARKKIPLSKEQRTWIKNFYKNRPEGYEVDHIIGLKSQLCCGLHVPANLQYLPMSDNRKKSRKWPTCQKSMQPACFDNLNNGVRV